MPKETIEFPLEKPVAMLVLRFYVKIKTKRQKTMKQPG